MKASSSRILLPWNVKKIFSREGKGRGRKGREGLYLYYPRMSPGRGCLQLFFPGMSPYTNTGCKCHFSDGLKHEMIDLRMEWEEAVK